jgi:hypothetical protein
VPVKSIMMFPHSLIQLNYCCCVESVYKKFCQQNDIKHDQVKKLLLLYDSRQTIDMIMFLLDK